jgi:peroxiredoxin family protein
LLVVQEASVDRIVQASSLGEEEVRRIVREEIERAAKKDPAKKQLALISSKGTLDWAYPPLILSTAGAAAGMDTAIFFTFYGLNIIHKDFKKKLKVSPVGNPAMPMPMPMADIFTSLPGMKPFATSMMKSMFKKKNVATIGELIEAALELDVKLIACQMTMDVFGYEEKDFIDGVDFGGAAAFLSYARQGHVTLFV